MKFVEIPNSRCDPIGTSPATPGVRNHLYIGFHNQQTSLGTDDDDVNHRLILGTHYPAPTDAEMLPSTVGETNEYKYDPTAPDSKMQYIWDPKAIHTKVALQMRGMDVLIADPASAMARHGPRCTCSPTAAPSWRSSRRCSRTPPISCCSTTLPMVLAEAQRRQDVKTPSGWA